MSKVASSNSDLTINADGSGNDIKFQSNGSEVGSINSSGTMTATAFSGDGSALTGISSGGGSGTVTSVDITSTNGTIDTSGGAITSSGTLDIELPYQGTSGSYSSADISVDDYGRITSASSGSSGSSGKVLQVVSTTKTSAWSSGSSSYVDITGLSAAITPSSSSSKVLVIVNLSESSSTGVRGFNLVRDNEWGTGATSLGMGAAASNRTRAMIAGYTGNADATHSIISHCGQYLDSPSTTSQMTYKMHAKAQTNYTVYINRTQSDTDVADIFRTSSTIPLMEIGE